MDSKASAQPTAAVDPLAHWRGRLRGVELPALSDDAAWRALLECGEDLDAVRERVTPDLPLALSLLVEANRSPRMAANLSGLPHVLRMLGSNAIQARLRKWPAGRLDPAQPAQPAQRMALQALATSRLACLFHARWMRHVGTADAEYRFWATAVLGVVRWKLPLADMALAQQIERRVILGERRQTVERSLLGCTLDEITSQHLEDLGFVDVGALRARMCLSPRTLAKAAQYAREDKIPEPLPPDLARELREPLVSCGLAQALALETQADWHSARCQTLIRAAATCLQRSANSVREELYRAALEASNEPLFTRGLLAPAARLIRIPRPSRLQRSAAVLPLARGSAPASKANRPAPARAPKADAGAQYLACCRRQGFVGLPEFLRASGRYLREAGFSRCALFVRMKRPERVNGYFAEGFADPVAARRTHFPPTSGALLVRLLADPRGAYLIQPAQVVGVRSKLPEALAEWPPAGGFVLATVQVNETPIGFWWADNGSSADSVDPRHFAAMRQLASVFGAEFTRLIRAQRAAARDDESL